MWIEIMQGLQDRDYSNLFEQALSTRGLWMQAKETDFALLKQKGHFLEG